MEITCAQDWEMRCEKCNSIIGSSIDIRTEKIVIAPCGDCIEESRREGYDAGYEEAISDSE